MGNIEFSKWYEIKALIISYSGTIATAIMIYMFWRYTLMQVDINLQQSKNLTISGSSG